MKGKYDIRVENKRIVYQFTVKRNLTIIRGNSATGKTTLVDMIRSYEQNGEESGILLRCKKPCTVLTDQRWESNLAAIHDSIVFIDEDYHFIRSEQFAAAVRKSDNYYVLITRDNLYNLPYSVNEIYGIHVSGKYSDLRKTYNELYQIYGEIPSEYSGKEPYLITEDSNSGYDFFQSVSAQNITCVSAQGKSNIYRTVMQHTDKTCLVIADGAAFGPEMERMTELIRSGYHLVLYLPESFEWLILKSGIIRDNELADILKSPENYIESKSYFSWERFFTALLTEKSSGTYYQYTKASLNKVYLHDRERKAILAVLPEDILQMILKEIS